MSTDTDFSARINTLKASLSKSSAPPTDGIKCIPTMMIVAAIIPILIFLILFFLTPGFVQTKAKGEKNARSTSKVFLYTFGITLVLWIGMYIYTYCSGYSANQVCRVGN